jgi:predicted DNA-binding protein YlxM (UPF0122 family)
MQQVKSLLEYFDYRFLNSSQIKTIEENYQPNVSIGVIVENANIYKKNTFEQILKRSNLKDIKINEILYMDMYTSLEKLLDQISGGPLSEIKSIIFEEESVKLTDQMLEYLCSGGNVEEIKVKKFIHLR